MSERPEDHNVDLQDDLTTQPGGTLAEHEGEHTMSETESTDPTSALPVADETTALPVADETSALPVADETTALPVADETSALPVADETSALPVAEPSEDPFRVEPDRPVPDDVVTADEAGPTATPLPQLGAPVPAWQPPAPITEPSRPPLVTVRKGPRGGTVVLGLLSLVVAAWVMASNLTDTDVNLRVFGPAAFAALGGLLLLVGLVGVLTGARRR